MLYWRAIDKSLLNKGFLNDIESFFSTLPGDWYVTAGYRSLQEQAKLYEIYRKGGPRAAPAGKSAHNYGLAIDVVLDANPDKAGLQPSWDIKLRQWVTLKLRLLNHPTLKHGSSFNDWPHVERLNWKDFI